MSVAEEWRAVPSAPGYEVSSLGNARSVRRRVTYSDGRVRVYPEAPLSPSLEGGGYKQVTCGKVGKRKIHRMVAEAFFGPSDLLVLHKNGNRTDNRVENLYYGTSTAHHGGVGYAPLRARDSMSESGPPNDNGFLHASPGSDQAP